MNILYEDDNLIVAEKPHGVPCQKDLSKNTDFLSSVEFFLKLNNSLSYNSNLHLLNRLDRPVGGIVLMAKNKISAKKYSDLIKNNEILKEYFAICNGASKELNRTLIDYIETDSKNNVSFISTKENGKYSKLIYETLHVAKNLSLLKINLITGRHHQIRIQLSNSQLPIYGDTKYNNNFSSSKNINIALWAFHISFKDPFSENLIDIYSYPDKNKTPWNQFSQYLQKKK